MNDDTIKRSLGKKPVEADKLEQVIDAISRLEKRVIDAISRLEKRVDRLEIELNEHRNSLHNVAHRI